MERKNDMKLEYLYSKIPKASILARIRIYEYNFKKKDIYGHKSGRTWLIKKPDGKEVEILQFLKDYAKECVENDAEIDGFMSGAYYEYYGVPLEYYAEKFTRSTHSQMIEREYSL